MKKALVSIVIGVAVWIWSLLVGPMVSVGEDSPGDPVYQRPDWPAGLADLLTRGGRVYGSSMRYELGRAEDSFYFSGDADDFNWFIEDYSKLEGTSGQLQLRPGPGRAERVMDRKSIVPFDWAVNIGSNGRLQINLTLCLGGRVDFGKVRVPANLNVVRDDEFQKAVAAQGPNAGQADKLQKGEPGDKPESGPVRPPEFKTKRLLFGKLALNEDGTKVLSVALDESGGTRTGYDLLYADTNFNGTFEESERFAATAMKRHGSWLASSSFASMNFGVPYNKKAEGIANPCQVTLAYRQYPRHGVAEDLLAEVKLRLRDGDTVWDYSFTGSVNLSKTPEKVSVWSAGIPKMEVTAQPDGRVKGNLGIGLKLAAAENEFLCWKGGKLVEARVEIKKPDGDVVHSGQATPDKFTFG